MPHRACKADDDDVFDLFIHFATCRNSMAHCCDARASNTNSCDSIQYPGYVSCVPKVRLPSVRSVHSNIITVGNSV